MSTPSLTPSPPPAGDPLTVPDRPAAKAGLLLLVLLMLGLLLWQMSQELRQQERFEHERAAAQLDRLNDRLSLTLELKARTALALLPGVPPSERGEIQGRLLPRISDALPQVRQQRMAARLRQRQARSRAARPRLHPRPTRCARPSLLIFFFLF